MAFKYAFIAWQTDEVKINLKRVRDKLHLFETSKSEETLSEAQK
jgi:hypothetical protein